MVDAIFRHIERITLKTKKEKQKQLIITNCMIQLNFRHI